MVVVVVGWEWEVSTNDTDVCGDDYSLPFGNRTNFGLVERSKAQTKEKEEIEQL